MLLHNICTYTVLKRCPPCVHAMTPIMVCEAGHMEYVGHLFKQLALAVLSNEMRAPVVVVLLQDHAPMLMDDLCNTGEKDSVSAV